jgi:hypothetical protein
MQTRLFLLSALSLAVAGSAAAATAPHGFVVEVLVDGRPLPEYPARGSRYIEALKGRDYAIRLRNPLGVRVAVALSVDGLNTIDARHTSATEARKWVLGPYEMITVSGWQTSMDQARRFYFTREERSYAERLGLPENMGIISAAFFRERVPRAGPIGVEEREGRSQDRSDRAGRVKSETSRPQPAPAPSAAGAAQSQEDEYAATGIGRRTDHPVQYVQVDLEDHPAATIDLRYEFRPQLVRLGVLPAAPDPDALTRRHRARGFEPGFCPEPRR